MTLPTTPSPKRLSLRFWADENTYARETLKFGENMTYKPSAREPGFNWDMKHHAYGPEGWEGTSTNVMGDIAYTMKSNPRMHVLLMEATSTSALFTLAQSTR